MNHAPPPVDSAAVTSPPAVQVSGLVKGYRGRVVVDGLDLVAATGRITAILGPNGAGKTTTIECCEGLRSPDAGRVEVLGLHPIADRTRLRPRVGVMLQDGGLPASAPAGAVLAHVAAMYPHPRPIAELADRLGLGAVARTPVRRLSGGQRQRLALAAAVVGRQELVFLDEPSAGLDPHARLAVWDLVRELRAEGTSIVLTTHQMTEAEELADTVTIIDQGTVIATGTVPELVGADTALRLRAAPGLDAAALARAASTATGRTVDAVEERPGSYRLTGAVDPQLVAAVTAWCAEQDVLIADLSTGRRTLEDVFLELTGRSLR